MSVTYEGKLAWPVPKPASQQDGVGVLSSQLLFAEIVSHVAQAHFKLASFCPLFPAAGVSIKPGVYGAPD